MTLDLPPEAFTKKTLQKAFSWLQDQPEELRDTVHTPERLVSLYQKSRRLEGREDLMGSGKFIHNLKKLADHGSSENGSSEKGLLSDQKPSNQELSTQKPLNQKSQSNPQEESIGETPVQNPSQLDMESSNEIPVDLKTSSDWKTRKDFESSKKTMGLETSNGKKVELDSLSKERVNEVRKRFNLASNQEALRLLISLGFEKFMEFR